MQAVYNDGEPAPLEDTTTLTYTLTYTASSTAYGSFYHDPCGYGCQKERGAVMTTRYRGMGSKRYQYLADGDHGDGSPPATEGPYYDTPVTISVTGGGLSGSTAVVIRGEHEVVPCSTGNAMLDDPLVQEGLRQLWRHAYLRDSLSSPPSPYDRLEYTGYIIPFLSGYSINMVLEYDYQNPRRANHGIYPSLLGVSPVVHVHTHPFAPSELIPTGDLQGQEPYLSIYPSLDDERALRLHEDALGVNVDGLVIDAVRMLLYDESGTRLAEFPRCGY